MSGLKNTVKRMANASMGKGYQTQKEKRAKDAAKEQGRLDTIYAGAQMPDEEVIQRNERRKAAKRRGSRQRNVLTDEDSLG
jgi:hypothetical protein